MEEITVLERCEEDSECIDQEVKEALILPYRYVTPVVVYKIRFGKLVGTVGYRISDRHFKHALFPFQKPDRLKNIELYLILLTGECRQIPLRKILIKQEPLEEMFLFIPK